MIPERRGHRRSMSPADDDDTRGIRGSDLADDAASGAAVPPDPDALAANGIRGDGLADGADLAGQTAPDADEAAEGGIRGDGLADDA